MTAWTLRAALWYSPQRRRVRVALVRSRAGCNADVGRSRPCRYPRRN